MGTDGFSTEEIQKRIAALEKSSTFQATQKIVQEEQMKMLETLRTIRESMMKNGGAQQQGASSGKEFEALKSENAALKKQAEKFEYRIKHLVRSLEEALQK